MSKEIDDVITQTVNDIKDIALVLTNSKEWIKKHKRGCQHCRLHNNDGTCCCCAGNNYGSTTEIGNDFTCENFKRKEE